MGLIDFVKNALFEVEYVEVKDPEAKKKKKNKKEINPDKPIAKKVVLNSDRDKKKEQVEEEEPEEILDIDEKEEVIENNDKKDFKVMDDNDFKVDDVVYPQVEEEKEEVRVEEKEEEVFPKDDNIIYRQEPEREKSTPYGIDESSKNLVPEYGKAYEKKEERTGFKPSPIISPIYGVLDKNYKKEDVVQKRDVRLSSYSRENVDVDDVRNKAYGISNERKKIEDTKKEEPKVEKKLEVEEEEDVDLLVDLTHEDKPSVKEVTMGDAMEYFQDLGLEYNVDYVDASKEKATGRRRDSYKKEPELFKIEDEEVKEEPKVEAKDNKPVNDLNEEETMESEVSKEKEEDNTIVDNTDDDNLFDLIDSMYEDK